jgi:Family of unknown function (DUF5989)
MKSRIGKIYLTQIDFKLGYTIINSMDFLKDLWNFLRVRKKWWLAPVIIILLIIGALLVFGGSSALAPFIYTLF